MIARKRNIVWIGIASCFMLVIGGCDEKQWQGVLAFMRELNPAPAEGISGMNTPKEPEMEIDPSNNATAKGSKLEMAMFGAGCFWGVEATFRKVPGVLDTAVGYSGGRMKNPTYQQVCTDKTGHAEVVRIEFDPAKVSYEQLLEIFWANHDSTTLNRQGPDIGKQYRSAVFFFTPEQEVAAKAMKAELTKAKRYRRPIVTEIERAREFWRAEEYHQRYLEKKGLDNCHF